MDQTIMTMMTMMMTKTIFTRKKRLAKRVKNDCWQELCVPPTIESSKWFSPPPLPPTNLIDIVDCSVDIGIGI